MKLTREGLRSAEEWKAAGYMLPQYDREAIYRNTMRNPRWIHFGAGNIFRAFQANIMQRLLNREVCDTGLIAAEGYDAEIIDRVNKPCDDYSILATLKADGSIEKTVIGSVLQSYVLDPERKEEFGQLKKVLCNPSLQMASFTITEKGYNVYDKQGELLPGIRTDLEHGPENPKSYIGKVASLIYARFLAGSFPLALVSMDNCSRNGERLSEAVLVFGEGWEERGLVQNGFLDYLKDPRKITFPWSMIDKITPRPDETVLRMLKADGLEDLDIVVTAKHTYTAPFVNAEECEYLVIEDRFPNGRPLLEKGGVIFTDRATVEKVEKMKVGACLNPIHTALAVFGCLLGYRKISDEMKQPLLKKLAARLGYDEGLPAAVNPGIIEPAKFLKEVLTVRIPNPFMPDTPQRIATDTSQKLAARFGGTIRTYLASESLSVSELRIIPLVFAGWLRYLLGVDDGGKPFPLSPDPMQEELAEQLKEIRLGQISGAEDAVRPILKNDRIFGVDLYQAGLAAKVLDNFKEMLHGPGAVQACLERELG